MANKELIIRSDMAAINWLFVRLRHLVAPYKVWYFKDESLPYVGNTAYNLHLFISCKQKPRWGASLQSNNASYDAQNNSCICVACVLKYEHMPM